MHVMVLLTTRGDVGVLLCPGVIEMAAAEVSKSYATRDRLKKES
jgi:hypothetical protein